MKFTLKSLVAFITIAGILSTAFRPGEIYQTVPLALIIALAVFGVHDLSDICRKNGTKKLRKSIQVLRGTTLVSIAIVSLFLWLPFASLGAQLRNSSQANARLLQSIELNADELFADSLTLLDRLDTNVRIERDFSMVPKSIRDLNPLSIVDEGEILKITMKPGEYVVALELVTDKCIFNPPFHREPGLWLWEGNARPFSYTKIR